MTCRLVAESLSNESPKLVDRHPPGAKVLLGPQFLVAIEDRLTEIAGRFRSLDRGGTVG
jgi:hypothetical protein